ncbi:MAG: branched-chain-amino-acid transaminase [Sandaracinaceae bacterium]
MTVVLIDGARVSADEARVSVLDRGFLFGDSVFEVLRTYAGRPFALEEHLDRLERSMRGMHMRQTFARAALRDEVERAIQAHREGSEDEAYVRLIVTRGQGVLHLDPRRATGSNTRVVIVAPLLPLPDDLDAGVSVATVHIHRPTDGTSAMGAKISAYVANLLALVEAQSRGAYEAVFSDADGMISEGSSSNLFRVVGETVETPPLSTGALPGITRRHVLDAARDLRLVVRERMLSARDFERADEAFLTSSLREVVPVTRIDGAPVGSGRVGPVTERLRAAYRARVLRATAVDAPRSVR